MSWPPCYFVDLLGSAIGNYHAGRFDETVREVCDPGFDVQEDDTFDLLCKQDGYTIYIYHLLECWVDSRSRPNDYPTLNANDWIAIAESLLEDIRLKRPPSDTRWNVIVTEWCHDCERHTCLDDGRFKCPNCQREYDFTIPENQC